MNFEFVKGMTSSASTYTVLNYHAGDAVTLQGYSGDHTTSAGGNTTLSLSDGTKITFVGVANASELNIHT
jgi:hypothetical protein